MRAVHGGDLRSLAARAGRDLSSILDFSANINPLGPPDGVRDVLTAFADDRAELERYPDPHYEVLREAIGRRHHTSPACVAVANGGAATIGAVVRALRPRRCVVAVPAFVEYAKALADASVAMLPVPLAAPAFELDAEAIVRAARGGAAEMCILTNPNNPTGVLASGATIVALARDLARFRCTLVVDEAFIDYEPQESCLAQTGECDAIVLRSLTKFYAIPGVRVGYAVAPPAVAESISASLPSWPIGAIDARIAAAAIAGGTYDDRSRKANAVERSRMVDALRDLGLGVLESAANFVFADVSPLRTTAATFAERLLMDRGIAVRCCDDYEGLPAATFVRIAVRTARDDDRLVAAIASLATAFV